VPEELTREQKGELRGRLVALRDELQELLQLNEEGTRPVDLNLPIGRLTRIDAIQQQQMAQAGRRSLEVRLRQVSAALACHERGEYGECQSCGEPIGYERLAARPETPLCLDCQDQAEAER